MIRTATTIIERPAQRPHACAGGAPLQRHTDAQGRPSVESCSQQDSVSCLIAGKFKKRVGPTRFFHDGAAFILGWQEGRR